MPQSEEVIRYAKDDKELRKIFPTKTYFLSQMLSNIFIDLAGFISILEMKRPLGCGLYH